MICQDSLKTLPESVATPIPTSSDARHVGLSTPVAEDERKQLNEETDVLRKKKVNLLEKNARLKGAFPITSLRVAFRGIGAIFYCTQM